MWNWLTGNWFGSSPASESTDEDKVEHNAGVGVENDLSPVCEAVGGSLNLYQIEEDMFIPVVKRGRIQLLEPNDTDSFSCVFQVTSQEGNVMARMEIKSDSQIKFDKSRHSIVWAVVSSDGSFHSLEFVFESPDEEIEFKKLLAIKIFEASRQEAFKTAIESEADQNWVIDAYEPEVRGSPSDEENEMDFDETRGSSRRDNSKGDKVHNSHLAVGMNNNRSYVIRGSQIGVFKHNQDDEMEYISSINRVKTKSGDVFSPSKAILHKGERSFLLLNPDDMDKVYEMDVETESVVAEYGRLEDVKIREISNANRYAQKTDSPLFVATNNNSVFTIDTRISGTDQTGSAMVYKKNPYLTAVATTGNGGVVVGSQTGEIKMFNDLNKRAKTSLPGLGHNITGMDTTEDGSWVLATTDYYLLLIPTCLSNGKTGFDVSMGKEKPIPYKLQLRPQDLAKLGIREVKFTSAKFDTGESIEEKWIITSTGPYLITWNFDKVKKFGIVDDYKIKKCPEKVVADQFRYNYANEVVVTLPDDVVLQKRKLYPRRSSKHY